MEQRRSQRYSLHLPLHIVEVSGQKVNRTEETRDISSGGVSFISPSAVEVGGRIEYLVTLSGNNPPVRIRCLGKVLRSKQPPSTAGQFEVACSMERYQFERPEEVESLQPAEVQ